MLCDPHRSKHGTTPLSLFYFFLLDIFLSLIFFYLAVNCEFPAVGPVIAFVAQSIEEHGAP
jgi:hypothetical protein